MTGQFTSSHNEHEEPASVDAVEASEISPHEKSGCRMLMFANQLCQCQQKETLWIPVDGTRCGFRGVSFLDPPGYQLDKVHRWCWP